MLHMHGITQYDGIGDEVQRTDWGLLTPEVAFTDFTAATIANHTCEIMPPFGTFSCVSMRLR